MLTDLFGLEKFGSGSMEILLVGGSLLVGVAPVPWVASSEDGLCTRYQACSGWG